MAPTPLLFHSFSFLRPPPPPPPPPPLFHFSEPCRSIHRSLLHLPPYSLLSEDNATASLFHGHFLRAFSSGNGSSLNADLGNYGPAGPKDTPDEQSRDALINEQDVISKEIFGNQEYGTSGSSNTFLVKLAVALGIAFVATLISAGFKQPFGSSFGFQSLAEGSSSSVLSATPVGFTFKAFGYRIVLPEYTPGWVYFWLLMAAGCGLFISEEALNIWVGISLARMLHLDGSWQSFAVSFSEKAPRIISTIFWVYWGVCISDMVPFYLGMAFRQTGAPDDICSKLGLGKEKATSITREVQRYGNFIGFVERFSLGVRNPTSFLAGAMGISPECFFAGVCLGGLVTLPLQLGIGFLMRETPVFALATVATAMGVWTVFPYAVAASTALFLFLRRSYFS